MKEIVLGKHIVIWILTPKGNCLMPPAGVGQDGETSNMKATLTFCSH